jgi:YD repeat-containing protein
MTYDAANQLLSEYHPVSGVKSWTYDLAGNRLSQDWTQVGVRSLTNWTYDAADQLATETTGTQVTTFTFDAAGNELTVTAPSGVTSNTWDSENRLVGFQLPSGAKNTMSYRSDGLRHQLWDSEGNKQMVWDSQGSSGYTDLLQERLP